MKVTKQARAIAERCQDAYSADAYTSWPAVAQYLLDVGHTDREVEAIMRSKVTRWAQQSNRTREPASAVRDWVQSYIKRSGITAWVDFVRELVAETPFREED